MTKITGTTTVAVILEVDTREDAEALIELVGGLAKRAVIDVHCRTEVNASPARTWRVSKVLLDRLRDGGIYELTELRDILVDHDFSPKSAGGIMTQLVREGDVEKVSRGCYRIVTKTDSTSPQGHKDGPPNQTPSV